MLEAINLPILYGQDLVWPDAIPEEEVTFIVGAVGSDGIVVATDTRETLDILSGSYNDDAIKSVRTSSDVVVAFGGAGQWAHQTVCRLVNAGKLSSRRRDACAVEILDVIRPMKNTFPDVSWFVAGVDPTPDVLYFERRGLGRGVTGMAALEWLNPLSTVDRGLWFVSTGSTVGRNYMTDNGKPGMPVDDLDELCREAVRAVGRSCFFVSPKVVVHVVRTANPKG